MHHLCPSIRRVVSPWLLSIVLLAAVSLALTVGLHAQSTAPVAVLTTLKTFGSVVGTDPEAAPIQGADGALYGVTSEGGANNSGTIYRRAADGTFTVLHDFTDSTDGSLPLTQLVQAADGFFYGTTYQGGPSGGGTVFKVSADGATFAVLHSLGSQADGVAPQAALTVGQDGVTLYGTTNQGGPGGGGTIFSLPTSGATFTTLYAFNPAVEGNSNTTSLVPGGGNTFYSANFTGGANGGGTVFSVTLSGNAATVNVLYNFDESTANGGDISGNLVLDNGTLFGTAALGGTNADGAVFAVKTDGSTTGSPLIHSFTNGTSGDAPENGLRLVNGRLYGTTLSGGANGGGVLFSLAEDGSGFAVLPLPTGSEPDLSVGTDGFLYGSLSDGGPANGGGIFQLSADGTTINTLYSFLADNAAPLAPLVQGPDGAFYGTTSEGGTAGDGTVFRVDAKGALTTLHDFTGTAAVVNAVRPAASTNGDLRLIRRSAVRPRIAPVDPSDGSSPNGGLLFAKDGFLYGTTEDGGDNDYGTLFRISTDGTSYTLLHSFASGTDGAYPEDALIQGTDGAFYGTAQGFGPDGTGTVFKLSADGATFTVLHAFNRFVDGAFPVTSLVQGTDGFLYGTTRRGGDSNNDGTVFKVSTDGATFTSLRFLTAATDGMNPAGTLVQGPNGLFYGTTEFGGADNSGAIFSISADGATFTLVHSFVGTDGGDLEAGLLLSKDGYFYGTTVGFNVNVDNVLFGAAPAATVNPGTGTFFRFSRASDFAVLGSATDATGQSVSADSNASLIEGADGFLYGTSGDAGPQGDGLIYQLAVTPVVRDLSLAGTQGTALSIQVPVYHNPTSITASALPAGLTLDPATGIISGTPTTAGTTTATITAANALGQTTAALTFTITPLAPVITSGPLPTGQVGTPYTYQITAANNPTSFGANNLPPGLTVDTGIGLISGTPTTAGDFNQITLSATNAGGTVSISGVIVIAPIAPVITSQTAVSTQVGVPFTYQIAAANTPTSFGATGLPAGLTVDTITGVISGTPTVAGSYGIGLSATNAAGPGTATLTLTVTPATTLPAPVINSPATVSGTAGTAFTYQITASNGATSFGATGLPDGLTLDPASGIISGTPTTAGTFTVTLTATSATGTGTTTLTITVSAAPVLAPVIDSTTAATATLNQPFAYQITASGNPASFNATGLPTGLGVNTQTGLITGTPTMAGTFTVTLTATNAGGMGTATLSLMVTAVANTAPVVTSAAAASTLQGTVFSYQITATNAPTSFGATGLPMGLAVDTTTGLITGIPSESGTFAVNLLATNATGTGTAVLTLTVTEVTPVVTVAVSGDGLAKEGGENGKVAVRRTGDLSAALTVRYKVTGDIVIGEDIKAGSVTGIVVIPAGAAQAKIKIKPIDDTEREGTRVVKVKLKPATDGSYILGSVTVAKVTLIDND